MFRNPDGNRYSDKSHAMWDALKRAAAKAGAVEPLTWHDLRRTCGCRLLQDRGLDISDVSAWLGHSDIRITQQRYAFLKRDRLQEAIAVGI